MRWLAEAFGFGKAVAEAADVPDDVDQARAIRHHFRELGRANRRLLGKQLSAPARISIESMAFGSRAALKRLGVDEGDIPNVVR